MKYVIESARASSSAFSVPLMPQLPRTHTSFSLFIAPTLDSSFTKVDVIGCRAAWLSEQTDILVFV